ncbi:hypothetical protein F5Y06DRAFT_64924 [Hypoxylon sp. FL0890]|nr:hypothetical protein F5Y06DRAFT_64924 [Hypoxylon sp. FL0890]
MIHLFSILMALTTAPGACRTNLHAGFLLTPVSDGEIMAASMRSGRGSHTARYLYMLFPATVTFQGSALSPAAAPLRRPVTPYNWIELLRPAYHTGNHYLFEIIHFNFCIDIQLDCITENFFRIHAIPLNRRSHRSVNHARLKNEPRSLREAQSQFPLTCLI